MCYLRHRLRMFYFVEKLCSVLKYLNFPIFNHLMIYQIFDVIMSISTWHKVYFQNYLLNHSSLSLQTWPIDWHKPGQHFYGIFWTIWKTGASFQILFNLETCTNYLITTYVKIPVLHFFEKVNKRHLKMVNFNY